MDPPVVLVKKFQALQEECVHTYKSFDEYVVQPYCARSTVEVLHPETPDFNSSNLWLPISPHLNLVDCKTWGCMQVMMQEHTRSQHVTFSHEPATGGSLG